MKLSPFMKEHKNNLQGWSKKRLINQILIGIETMAHQGICNDNLIKQLQQTEGFLESAENALIYKDKIIEKYKSLLDFSIDNE